MKKRIVALIPARMDSTRFPGKPIENILDMPMIEHVRRRVELFSSIDEVYVATCDYEIKDIVESGGGKVIMTSSFHERCTDRIEEAAHNIDADIVVNVQGDEPMVMEDPINKLLEPFLSNDNLDSTCLVFPIENIDELESDNIVKVVLDRNGKIVYLSRSVIPGRKKIGEYNFLKQSGLMAFTKRFLHYFTKLEPTPLEKAESVDVLRIIEHGHEMKGIIYPNDSKGVDIPEQIVMIENIIKNDPIQFDIYTKIIS